MGDRSTDANELVAEIHDRMPLIVAPGDRSEKGFGRQGDLKGRRVYLDRRLRQGEFFGDESAAFAERGKAARSLGDEGAVALQKFEGLDLVREHVSAIARGGASPEIIEERSAEHTSE